MSIPIRTEKIAQELINLDNKYIDENINTYVNLIVLYEEKDLVKQKDNIIKEWTTEKGIGEYFYNKYGLYFDIVNMEYFPENNRLKVYIKLGLDQPSSISNFDITKYRK